MKHVIWKKEGSAFTVEEKKPKKAPPIMSQRSKRALRKQARDAWMKERASAHWQILGFCCFASLIVLAAVAAFS